MPPRDPVVSLLNASNLALQRALTTIAVRLPSCLGCRARRSIYSHVARFKRRRISKWFPNVVIITRVVFVEPVDGVMRACGHASRIHADSPACSRFAVSCLDLLALVGVSFELLGRDGLLRLQLVEEARKPGRAQDRIWASSRIDLHPRRTSSAPFSCASRTAL